jgi:hypothetical protein
MPAIIVVSFGHGLAEPDLIFGDGMADLVGQQFWQPGLGGQRHHRHQPSARHEMLIIEDHRRRGEPVGHFHRKCLSAWT